MRAALVTVAMAALGISIVGFTPNRHHTDLFRGRTAEQWYQRAVVRREQRDDLQQRLTRRVLQVRRQQRALVHRASSLEALKLAAIAYQVDYGLLYRIASCESTGGDGLNPNAKNRHSTAAGLGQFLDSTWASTPYSSFSVYSPYANALAIANEVKHGNTGWQWAASAGCWS